MRCIFDAYFINKSDSIVNNPWYFTKLNYSVTENDNNIVSIIDSGYIENSGFNENNIIDKYNAINENDDVTDNNGHGSAILSLLIGFKNNDVEIFGINPAAKVMIVKAVNEEGKASASVIAKSILYSVNNGANIINISLGTRIPNKELEEAINYAYEKNVYIVAAAGDMNYSDALYPARYDNVIAVQAQDNRGLKYIFSNDIKENYVKIPGVEINVAYYDYDMNNWTSSIHSGSSLASIIFSGLLSTLDNSNYQLNFVYFYNINNYIFLDYERLRYLND